MSSQESSCSTPRWMRGVLLAAGVCNLVWGGWVTFFPSALFNLSGMQSPRYPQLWQCAGLLIGFFGIGYLVAARHPVRYWRIVAIGLIGKVLGPLGFLIGVSRGDLTWSWGVMALTTDLVWWLPFAAILLHAACVRGDTSAGVLACDVRQVMTGFRSHRGVTLDQLSREKPTVLIFLRHTGCTFCRAALSDLQRVRTAVERMGVRLAIVHMSTPLAATMRLERHGLGDLHRFSDPQCVMYRAFGLQRGTVCQLVGPAVWWKVIRTAILEGHGLGRLEGDGFRLSGVFLLRNGTIVTEHRAANSADRPDFVHIARQAKAVESAQSRTAPRPADGAIIGV